MSLINLRQLFISFRDFLRNDDQAIHKLAFTFTTLIAVYLLNKIECILLSTFIYIFVSYGTILIGLSIFLLITALVLFQNEILNSAKSVDQTALNVIGASLCLILIGFVFVPIIGGLNSQTSRLNDQKNFDITQFKVEIIEQKTLLKNNLVTIEHLNDLRKNFNSIIKALVKAKSIPMGMYF